MFNINVSIDLNGTLIYIEFNRGENQRHGMLHDIKSQLLYDQFNNWVGIKIDNHDLLGRNIKLPKINCNKNVKNASITQTDTYIEILFDYQIEINNRKDIASNIDYGENSLMGIEIILREKVGELDIVRPYVKHDM